MGALHGHPAAHGAGELALSVVDAPGLFHGDAASFAGQFGVLTRIASQRMGF
jgi:hypothetical protein